MQEKISIGDYDKIMSDRKLFNEFVYTPLSEALKLLEERQKDPELMAKVEKLLNGDIPEVLKGKKCGVQFRQIATPNNETHHFISITKDNNLETIFFEYLDDKFTSNNEFKHSLGQLNFEDFVNKKDKFLVEKVTIIDFNKADGKKIREIKTIWNESLFNFHRKLFKIHNYNFQDHNFFDASLWLKRNGSNVSNYYINIFIMFSCFGILFENFLNSKNSEGEFTRNIVLPALEEVINLIGIKPLIVPIDPIDIENEVHWVSYNKKMKDLILKIQL